jgi:hypothetical protein
MPRELGGPVGDEHDDTISKSEDFNVVLLL